MRITHSSVTPPLAHHRFQLRRTLCVDETHLPAGVVDRGVHPDSQHDLAVISAGIGQIQVGVEVIPLHLFIGSPERCHPVAELVATALHRPAGAGSAAHHSQGEIRMAGPCCRDFFTAPTAPVLTNLLSRRTGPAVRDVLNPAYRTCRGREPRRLAANTALGAKHWPPSSR